MTDQEMERYLASRAQAMPVPPPDFSRLRERVPGAGEDRRAQAQASSPSCGDRLRGGGSHHPHRGGGVLLYQRYLASEYGAYPFRTTNIAVCWEFGVNLPLHLEDMT